MSELVVFTYEHPDRAAEVLQHVASLRREHIRKPVVTIEDAAVAFKGDDGQVRIRQTLETATKAGTVATGGLWGVLVGFLFGGPLLGAMVGAGVSWLVGRRIDIGIDNDFIQQVTDDLKPGRSALLLLVKDTPIDTLPRSSTPRAVDSTTRPSATRRPPPSPRPRTDPRSRRSKGRASLVTADPTTLAADGSATSLLTVQLKDAYGNDIDTAGANVTFATPSHGSIGNVGDTGSGTYTATYTAGTSPGSVTITPRLDGTDFTNTTTITLTESPQQVQQVVIDGGDLTLDVGDTRDLTATVSATGGAPTTVTWTSSATAVATIDASSGNLTAVGDGTTTITATSACADRARRAGRRRAG
jgi:uncharacterized membrane protein